MAKEEHNAGGGRLVCVTGASGFFASWLVRCLLIAEYRVRATVRNARDGRKVGHLLALPGAAERLELFEADLLASGSFDAAVEGCEGVFHTASPVLSVKSDPEAEMIKPAVCGTLNVLESCARSSSVRRVVVTSSTAAVRFTEDLPPDSRFDESSWSSEEFCRKYKMWYHLAKTLAEKAAWEFSKKTSIDLAVVVPSFIVGPIIPSTLSSTSSDVLGLLKGDPTKFALHSRMGYVHVDDVAMAHILVYNEPSAQGRYICSCTVVENHELGEMLAKRYPNMNVATRFPNTWKVPFYTLDSSKLQKLGFQLKPLERMFDDCVQDFKEKCLL